MKKGLMLVLLTAIISGVSIFLNAFGVKGINPYIFTGAKNVLVAVFLFSIILMFKDFKELKSLKIKDWASLSLIGLIGGSIPFLLFFKGLTMMNPAQGSFVHKTMVLWVVILSVVFLKEKLNKQIVFGAIALLAGNFMLLKLTSFEFSIGTVLIFVATLFWATEITLSKYILKNLSSNIVAFGRMFFGSIFILLFLGFTNQLNLVATLNFTQFGWIAITSVLLLGYVFTFYNGLKHVNASTAVAILSLGSVITTLLKLVFLDKMVVPVQIIGMALIVSGVLFFSINLEKKLHSNFSTAKP
jgi:drug/metabolite transporter (DMT)-like permease